MSIIGLGNPLVLDYAFYITQFRFNLEQDHSQINVGICCIQNLFVKHMAVCCSLLLILIYTLFFLLLTLYVFSCKFPITVDYRAFGLDVMFCKQSNLVLAFVSDHIQMGGTDLLLLIWIQNLSFFSISIQNFQKIRCLGESTSMWLLRKVIGFVITCWWICKILLYGSLWISSYGMLFCTCFVLLIIMMCALFSSRHHKLLNLLVIKSIKFGVSLTKLYMESLIIDTHPSTI